MKKLYPLTVLIAIAIIVPCQATIINIPDDYATIQDGINASNNGDTVLVQPGTYVENINFNGHSIVLGSLFLTTGNTSYISQTIIDGNSSGTVITFENGEDSTAIITGFTISNGFGSGYPDYSAGGIHCFNSNPTISNNEISENSANRYSTGIRCWYSDPIIGNNTISENSGGGIICWGSNPLINGNIIISNTIPYHPNFFRYGAGIFCGASDPVIINNTISRNRTDIGGGISISFGSNPAIINTVFWANSALIEDDEINISGGSPSFTYCNIQGGWEGEGNIDADPMFVDPDNGNFHLMAIECGDSVDSPCIDAGHPALIDSLLDCSWGLGTILSDMGAFGGGDSAGVKVDDLIKQLPKRFTLSQNYPNPFNASTVISYNLPKLSAVTIDIYDILGRKVQTLQDGAQPAGSHDVIWRADKFASGVYFYRLTAGEYVNTRKMVLLK